MKKRLSWKDVWLLIRDSALAWDEDNSWRLGAALAYFTIFSLAPLLIIVTAVSSIAFGEDAVRGNLFAQIKGLIGEDGAGLVETMIKNAYRSDTDWIATIIGIVTLLLGASAVIVELRGALNSLWRIQEKPLGTFLAFLRGRLFSLAMILGMGFLFMVSLVMSALLAVISSSLTSSLTILGGTIDFLVSFVGVGVVVSLIFKFLCEVRIVWKDVFAGAAVTSLLFFIGKFGIGYYLGTSGIGTTFGAAGSLVTIILWTFYSIQIVLFGAEFTRLYAKRFGSDILPRNNALRVHVATTRDLEHNRPVQKKITA